jgi:zinc protease
MNERRFRVDDSVDGTLNEALYRHAFEQHPYHWPTIGWMQDIEAITIEDCRAFYRTYYAPNNATVVIVGDLEEEATLAAVQGAYGPIARQPVPAEHIPPEALQTAPRRWEVHKAVPADRVHMGWRAVGQGSPDHATLDVVAELMGGGNASRLYRALVVDRELASSVQASVAPFRDPGLFEISVALTRGHRAEEAEAVVAALLAALAKEGPRPGEVDGARARLLTRFWTGLRPQSGKAEALGHAEVTLGDYRRIFEAPERYAKVDADAVQRVVRTYLDASRCTTVVARPLETP